MTNIETQWLYVTFTKSLCDPSNDFYAFTITMCDLHNDFLMPSQWICVPSNPQRTICAFLRIVLLTMILSAFTICCESSQWLCVTFTMFLCSLHTPSYLLCGFSKSLYLSQWFCISSQLFYMLSQWHCVLSECLVCPHNDVIGIHSDLCHLHMVFLNYQNNYVTFTANLCDLHSDFL